MKKVKKALRKLVPKILNLFIVFLMLLQPVGTPGMMVALADDTVPAAAVETASAPTPPPAPATAPAPDPTPVSTPVIAPAPALDPASAATDATNTTGNQGSTEGTSTIDPDSTGSPQAEAATTENPAPTPEAPKEIWSKDGDKATTNDPVEKDIKYVAPQNDQVMVTFTKLPDNPGTLSIEEITLTKEQVADFGALSNKAYDITSDMADETFKYNLTLPKVENNISGISYIEKSADELDGVKSEEVKKIDENKIDVKSNTVEATGIDHFTIFIITDGNAVYPTGTWTTVGDGGYNGSGFHYPTSTAAGDRVEWPFTSLSGTKNYAVFASWSTHPNRSTSVKYEVDPASGSNVPFSGINQEKLNDQTTAGGVNEWSGWYRLGTGTFQLDNSSKLTLFTEDNSSGVDYVIADDVALVSLDDIWVDDNWAGMEIGEEIDANKIFGGNAFTTIQEGVDAAEEDAVIHVMAGTYPESVIINKSVNLRGFNADISGTGSRAAEAIVNQVNITASGVIVDGFSFTNPGIQMNINGATILAGVKVQNNIFSGYQSVGVPTNNAGNLLITRNLFRNPLASTEAMQIKANISGGCTGTTVSNNTFTAATNNDGADINFTCTGTNSTGVTVSGNTDTGLAGADTNRPSFTAFSGVTGGIVVTNNTVTGTPTSGSAIFFFGGVTGSVDISDNSITGGANNGIDVTSLLGENNTGVFTFTNNNLSGNLQSIRLRNAFGVSATVTAHRNNVSGNTAAGILNESTAFVVDATNNLWGDVSGPKDIVPDDGSILDTNPSGTGSSAIGAVKYVPWYTDEAMEDETSPNAITQDATDEGLYDATLNGTNGDYAADNTSFWWGTSSIGSFTSAVDPSSQLGDWSHDTGLGAKSASAPFSYALTGLTPSTPYHFVAWSLVDDTWYPGAVLDFTTANGPVFIDANVDGVLDSGEPSFNTIQDAINAAIAGDTIHVTAGTYTEIGQIVIDKNLSIVGADKATTIIKPSQNTGGDDDHDGRAWILVNSGESFTLENVTLDGTGKNIHTGIRNLGNTTLTGNIIKNISYPGYFGFAVSSNYEAAGNTLLTVKNNTFSGYGRVGVHIDQGSGTSMGLIDNNIFIGKGEGDYLDYAIEVETGASATITNNDISNNKGIALVGDYTSAGILATTYFGSGTNITLTDNSIHDNSYGIELGSGITLDTTSVTQFDTNIFNNNTHDLDNSTISNIDARNNTWSVADQNNLDQIEAKINHNCSNSTYVHGICTSDDYSTGGMVQYKDIGMPSNLGWNVGSKSATPNETSYDLACATSGIYTSENSVAQNWSVVSGANIKYQREVTFPSSSVSLINAGSNNYTPFVTFGSATGIEGLWKTRVRAYVDANNNNTYDSDEEVSGWSNECNITFDNTDPVKPAFTAPINNLFTHINFVTLTWSDGDDTGTTQSGIKGYTIRYTFVPMGGGATVNWASNLIASGNPKTHSGSYGHGEGTYTMYVSTTDNAGNTSFESDPLVLNYDATAPALSSQTTFSGWYDTNQISTFTYSDASSVVSGMPVTCDIATEGLDQTCNVTPTVCDAAGNCNITLVTSNGADIDKTNPTSVITTFDLPNGASVTTSTWNGRVDGTASDDRSGVDFVKLEIARTLFGASLVEYWNGSGWQDTSAMFNASGDEIWNYQLPGTVTQGRYQITSHAIDNAGNEETTYSITIIYDKTIPEITLTIDPVNSEGDNNWYLTNPTVTLTANDNDNVESIEYQLNSTGGEWITYASPVTLDDGIWQFYYRSIDTASNASGIGLKNVKVDTMDPDNVSNLDATYKQAPNRVQLTWDVNDSDIDQVYIYRGKSKNFSVNTSSRIAKNPRNDANYSDYDVTPGEKYYYKVVTVDKAGNKSNAKVISIALPTEGTAAVVTNEGTEVLPANTVLGAETGNEGQPAVTEEFQGETPQGNEGQVLGEEASGPSDSGGAMPLWQWFLIVLALLGLGYYGYGVYRGRRNQTIR